VNASDRGRTRGPSILDDPAVVKAFDRVAKMPQMRLLRSLVISRALAYSRSGDAVDVGCGAGHLVVELAARAPQLKITGVDPSKEMLAAATVRADEAGLKARVCFRPGDARSLPFLDGSVDLVVSSLALHHWPKPVVALDEIDRVLRRPDPLRSQPGGAYVLLDLRRDISAPARALLAFATRAVVPQALREMDEPLASSQTAYTPAEAAQMLSRSRLSGWRVVRGPLWLIITGRVTGQRCIVPVSASRDTATRLAPARLPRSAEQWTG
jgi:ubiquinone/menaquinone biosynthesis C-methylase UbiE